jgi:hypothetical protein
LQIRSLLEGVHEEKSAQHQREADRETDQRCALRTGILAG